MKQARTNLRRRKRSPVEAVQLPIGNSGRARSLGKFRAVDVLAAKFGLKSKPTSDSVSQGFVGVETQLEIQADSDSPDRQLRIGADPSVNDMSREGAKAVVLVSNRYAQLLVTKLRVTVTRPGVQVSRCGCPTPS